MTECNKSVQVSIFCLAYNHAKYITRCIESILTQETTFEFELIVHDDASSDGTSQILRDFAKKDSRVRLFVEDTNQYNNDNLSYLRDIFLPMSRGRYVAFCEGDDCWIDCHKLQDQFEYMENHPECSMCSHLAQVVDGVTGEPIGEFGYGEHDRVLTLSDLLGDWKIPTASTFLRKEELQRYVMEWTFKKPVGDFPRAVYFASLGNIYYSGKMQAQYRYSVPGSWTTLANVDPVKRLQASTGWLRMLDEIDRKLGYSHHLELVSLAKGYVSNVYQFDRGSLDACPMAREAVAAFSAFDWVKTAIKWALYKMGFQLVSIGPGGTLGWRLVRVR